jgi:hypothetical protein
MTPAKYNELQIAAQRGTISDDENAAFIFSLTHNKLLVQIAAGKIDCQVLAKLVLEGRGYDANGKEIKYPKK